MNKFSHNKEIIKIVKNKRTRTNNNLIMTTKYIIVINISNQYKRNSFKLKIKIKLKMFYSMKIMNFCQKIININQLIKQQNNKIAYYINQILHKINIRINNK